MADSIARSIAKTLTWRVIAVGVTTLISYYVIGMIHPEWPSHVVREGAMIIGAADMLIKMKMNYDFSTQFKLRGMIGFLDRHRESFAKNHRMSQQVFGLNRLSDLPELKERALEVLEGLEKGTI